MVIIVDEAHNFRNEYIQDYALLHELCQNNKVVLLRRLLLIINRRIFFNVETFPDSNKSTLKTVKNLNTEFGQLINEYKILRKAQKEKASMKRKLGIG